MVAKASIIEIYARADAAGRIHTRFAEEEGNQYN